jgi:pimeloyl-ACP methyl ester carboxylesterase
MVAVGGIRLRVQDQGRGEPVLVLLHGFGLSLFSWHRVAPALAAGHRVVAFDRPGFGRSDRPDPGGAVLHPAYTPAGAADLTVGLLDALGVGRAVLVGHSAGALVAARVAVAAPDRVAGLVLVSPVLEGGPPRSVTALSALPGSGAAGPWLLRGLARAAGRRAVRSLTGTRDRRDPVIEAGYLDGLQVPGWERPLWAMTRHHRQMRDAPELERLHLPVLVVAGTSDRIATPASIETLLARLPTARLLQLEGCGHMPLEQEPDAVVDAVTGFVASLPE